MFPYSYRNTVSISRKDNGKTSIKALIEKFKTLFDTPQIKSQDTIVFDSFNVFFKRHSWMSGGRIKITLTESNAVAELSLHFYSGTVILALGTLGLIFLINKASLVIFAILSFWVFYSLLFLWTTTMYNLTIKNVMNRQVLVKEEYPIVLLTDACPACNNKIMPEDVKCSDCGLVFNNH